MAGKRVSICIVGAGPRGLGVLERVGEQARLIDSELTVHLVDPLCDGSGVYRRDSPDYLLLNIVARQVSLFPHDDSVSYALPTRGPSLYEWATDEGLRLDRDGMTISSDGRPVRSDDFLPRRVLGEYLAWFLDGLEANLPRNVSLIRHRATVIDIEPRATGWSCLLDSRDVIHTDNVVLTIGQGGTRPHHAPRLVDRPYPLPDQVERVAPSDTVAIAGMGLTAMDVVMALTVGRGGRFKRSGGSVAYESSGDEPRMVLYSQSGLPYRSRPRLPPEDRTYTPLVFTPAAVRSLRLRKGTLDFDSDVLPLAFDEMRVAYYLAKARISSVATYESRRQTFQTAHAAGHLEDALQDCSSDGCFDPAAVYYGGAVDIGDEAHEVCDADTYEATLIRWIAADLAEAERGLVGSALKAALEVLRSCRDSIRAAVDYGGLTSASQRDFFRRHSTLINKAVVGPQKERTAELLALFDAGFVSAPSGPSPSVRWSETDRAWLIESTRLPRPSRTRADWLIHAHGRVADPVDDVGLVGTLLKRGLLSRGDSCGIATDALARVLAADGRPVPGWFVIGPLCEGASYYNNYITSPGRRMKSMHDADHVAANMLAAADG